MAMLPGRAHGGGVRVVEILRMGLGIVDVARRIMDPVGAGGGTRQRLGQDGQARLPQHALALADFAGRGRQRLEVGASQSGESPIGDRLALLSLRGQQASMRRREGPIDQLVQCLMQRPVERLDHGRHLVGRGRLGGVETLLGDDGAIGRPHQLGREPMRATGEPLL